MNENPRLGAQVMYGERRALVLAIKKNGIRIVYDGAGLQRGEYVHKTVSRTSLAPVNEHKEHGGWE